MIRSAYHNDITSETIAAMISRGDDPPRCRIPEVLTPIKRATEIIVHVVRKPDVIIDPSSRAERADAEEN